MKPALGSSRGGDRRPLRDRPASPGRTCAQSNGSEARSSAAERVEADAFPGARDDGVLVALRDERAERARGVGLAVDQVNGFEGTCGGAEPVDQLALVGVDGECAQLVDLGRTGTCRPSSLRASHPADARTSRGDDTASLRRGPGLIDGGAFRRRSASSSIEQPRLSRQRVLSTGACAQRRIPLLREPGEPRVPLGAPLPRAPRLLDPALRVEHPVDRHAAAAACSPLPVRRARRASA